MIQKIFLLLLSKLFQIIPLSISLFIGRRLGDFVYSVLHLRRKVVMQNLNMVFGNEKSIAELKCIAKHTYQNFGMTLIEFIRLPITTVLSIKKYIRFDGKQYLDSVLAQNRGVIVMTGHFNNWELMGAAHTFSDYKVSVYARKLRNSVVNDLVNGNRTKVGMEVISKQLATREMLKALKTNHIIAFLIDQDARSHGIFVDFFGKPASTFRGPASFSVRTKTPILPIFMSRENHAFHLIHIEPPLIPNPEANEDEEIVRLTQAATRILEDYIRRYPDQYFWFHKRWKTQPNVADNKNSNL
ncbi:MAG: lysophospholipid acyltransferase family protein [bacterium]